MENDGFVKVNDKLRYDSREENILGKGRHGIVFPGYLTVDGGSKKVAVKRLQRHDLNQHSIKHEVDMMLKAKDHPNILHYMFREASTDNMFLFVVTELCRGTLDDYIKEPSKIVGLVKISEKEILHQLAGGLAYLHGLDMIHRDIKPSNILISIPEGDGGKLQKPLVKLADFGLSKLLKPSQDDTTNSNLTNPSGTRGWMAPEMYSTRYDNKVDIFPLGCVFAYTLNGGKHPFGDDEDDRTYKIKNKKPTQLILYNANNDLAFELIQSMIKFEPQKRPTAEQVFNHSFFKTRNAVEKDSPFALVQTTAQFVQFCYKDALKNLSEAEIVDFVQRLAANKAIDINATFPDGRTLLHYLCSNYANHDSLICFVSILIERGASLNSTDRDGETPLFILCEKYKRDDLKNLVELFIENDADSIHKRTSERWNLLHILCRYYDNKNLIHVLRLLIRRSILDVNAQESQGRSTPLHFLLEKYSQDNMVEIVTFMIQNRVNVNAMNVDLWTPLHNLIYHYKHDNMIDIVDLLISRGAYVNARTSMGYTPLHFLSRNSSLNFSKKKDIDELLRVNYGAVTD